MGVSWKRWLVVEFYGDFEKKVREFEKNLVEEIPRAIAIGVAALYRVLVRGFFSFENTERDARHLWLSKSDSVYAFVDWAMQNKALEKAGYKTAVRDLYEIYVKYCEKSDIEAKAQALFTKRLKELGFSVTTHAGTSYLSGYRLDKGKAETLLKQESPHGE